ALRSGRQRRCRSGIERSAAAVGTLAATSTARSNWLNGPRRYQFSRRDGATYLTRQLEGVTALAVTPSSRSGPIAWGPGAVLPQKCGAPDGRDSEIETPMKLQRHRLAHEPSRRDAGDLQFAREIGLTRGAGEAPGTSQERDRSGKGEDFGRARCKLATPVRAEEPPLRPFEGDGAVQEGSSTHVGEVVGPYPKLAEHGRVSRRNDSNGVHVGVGSRSADGGPSAVRVQVDAVGHRRRDDQAQENQQERGEGSKG